jgi:endogenous inhibitor of DNA gyrase (YacG/DUF329 family)
MDEKIKKICATCKEEKYLDEFSKDKNQNDGYTYSCKKCRNLRYNEWAKKNKDKVKERNTKQHNNRKEYYQSERGVESSRRTHLKRKYNMTLEKYNEMLDFQNNVCLICEQPENCIRNKFLAVDHCHITNKIRGLLCTNCNRAIGLLKENIETMEKMIKYIKKHKN